MFEDIDDDLDQDLGQLSLGTVKFVHEGCVEVYWF